MIYDISPRITPSLQVWPGDTAPSREVLLDMLRGDHLTLSTLHATVHLGAHADAPNHYAAGAADIAERALDLYLGPCEVVHVNAKRGTRIGLRDIPAAPRAERLLIATNTFPNPQIWNEDFAGLEPALVDHLHTHGVRLVGVDTPSVDLMTAKDLPAHAAFHRHDMAILEGLVLADVPAGIYELIALPLKLADFDASPVRAILRTLPTPIT